MFDTPFYFSLNPTSFPDSPPSEIQAVHEVMQDKGFHYVQWAHGPFLSYRKETVKQAIENNHWIVKE